MGDQITDQMHDLIYRSDTSSLQRSFGQWTLVSPENNNCNLWEITNPVMPSTILCTLNSNFDISPFGSGCGLTLSMKLNIRDLKEREREIEQK